MTDHPLLFRPEMVRALLEGRKTQTRRPRWRLTEHRDATGGGGPVSVLTAAARIKVGDRVWVKETFATDPLIDNGVRYYATDNVHELRKKRSPVHMPRWASRLTLAVTGARVERLQDISEADAIAEGAQSHRIVMGDARCGTREEWSYGTDAKGNPIGAAATARDGYALLYERIHGRDAWAANPEVVVLTFTVHKANIDAFKKQAAAA